MIDVILIYDIIFLMILVILDLILYLYDFGSNYN